MGLKFKYNISIKFSFQKNSQWNQFHFWKNVIENKMLFIYLFSYIGTIFNLKFKDIPSIQKYIPPKFYYVIR